MPKGKGVTPAHTQEATLHVHEYYPAHEPRESDPHYHLFHEAREKLRQLGKLKCWVCGKDEAAAGQPIELHHSVIEFALANGVDVAKFAHLYPEFNVTDEATFVAFVESEGNLLPLCLDHHRGCHGIHSMTYSPWVAQAFWRSDLPAPAKRV